MSKYTTGEIAKLCNISVRTVQYYDTRGLVVPSELTEGGRRLYSEEDLSKMKIVCFLREVDVSIDTISKLFKEENSGNVISLILEEQEKMLREEISDKQEKLDKLEALHQTVKKNPNFSVESILDVANVMENKKNLKRVRITMLVTAIPLGILQWGSIIEWIVSGNWWPFIVWLVVAVPYGICISKYYFNRVAYICPECHEVFVPKFKEAFFANHTPTTRKLTCTKCGYKGFCVETYKEK